MGSRPWDCLESKFHPKQRIFMSIDAIGSTSIKSRMIEYGCSPDEWATTFLAFLPKVQDLYNRKFIEIVNTYCMTEECEHKCVPDSEDNANNSEECNLYNKKASVWKYIGDEVILAAELTCRQFQPSLYVLALAETIKLFNDNFMKSSINIGGINYTLQCKGAAWVAGFPVTNMEIILPGAFGNVTDYLGPSIDLGFRLAHFATPERLIVSASLASLIINGSYLKKSIPYFSDTTPRVHLCFGGVIKAKGVKNGEHPLIWYPVTETDENKLCIVKNDDLKNYFHNDYFNDSRILPFIVDDKYINQKYYEEYEKAISRQKQIPNSIFYNTI